MAPKYFMFADGQRLPGERVEEFLMNQAVIQCANQDEIVNSNLASMGARVAINLEDGQLWTYTEDIEAWAPAQNTLDLELLDSRYYTKVAANGIFISETTANARYLTEVTARGIFLTATEGDTKYYTKLQADGLFLSETSADTRYYTKLAADGLFMTQTTSDARYYTKLQADGLYLGKVEAGNTYVTTVSAGQIYLSKTDANTTYITQIGAGELFVSKGGAAGDINSNSTTISGGKITTDSINVNRLIAGTLTGFRIQTSSSGKRVVISESTNSVVFFNSAGSERGRIQGETGLNIEGATGVALQIDGVGTVFSVNQSGVSLSPGQSFNSNLPVVGNLSATGSVQSDTFIRAGAGAGATLNTNGDITVPGTTRSQGQLIVGGTSTYAGTAEFAQGVFRTGLAGGGTTTASFNNSGALIRTASSARYKRNVEDLSVPYESILAMQPKKFRMADEVEENPNSKYYPGFIAEDLAGTDLDIFVFYSEDEDGNPRPEGIHYAELTAALVSAIKEQDSRMNALEARLATLENPT